jgi:hypothetical protein
MWEAIRRWHSGQSIRDVDSEHEPPGIVHLRTMRNTAGFDDAILERFEDCALILRQCSVVDATVRFTWVSRDSRPTQPIEGGNEGRTLGD